MTETTSGKNLVGPLLNFRKRNIETGGDATALVESAVEGDNDLTRSVVINDFNIIDVTVLLHDAEELEEDLGARSDKNLSLTTVLSVGDSLSSVGQNVHKHFLEMQKDKSEVRRES